MHLPVAALIGRCRLSMPQLRMFAELRPMGRISRFEPRTFASGQCRQGSSQSTVTCLDDTHEPMVHCKLALPIRRQSRASTSRKVSRILASLTLTIRGSTRNICADFKGLNWGFADRRSSQVNISSHCVSALVQSSGSRRS
jgi:hypothetical protein